MDFAEWATAYSSPTVQKDLRDFFRTERKRQKLTQVDVAVESGGVDQGTISKIERDAPYEPSVSVFIRAIRGLGMRPSEFFARFETQRALSDRTGQTEKRILPLQSPDVSENTAFSPATIEAQHGQQRRQVPPYSDATATAIREMQAQIDALKREIAILVASREADDQRRERVSATRARKSARTGVSRKTR